MFVGLFSFLLFHLLRVPTCTSMSSLYCHLLLFMKPDHLMVPGLLSPHLLLLQIASYSLSLSLSPSSTFSCAKSSYCLSSDSQPLLPSYASASCDMDPAYFLFPYSFIPLSLVYSYSRVPFRYFLVLYSITPIPPTSRISPFRLLFSHF